MNCDCPLNIEPCNCTSVEKFPIETMAMSKFSKSSSALPPSVLEKTAPIPFDSKVKKMDKVDGSNTYKSVWIKFKFLIDPDNPASNYSQQFAIFKDGCPEVSIKGILMKEPADNAPE
jgi:hypothetical protein